MNIYEHAAQRDKWWYREHPGQAPDYGERDMRAEFLEEMADGYNYARRMGLPQSAEELVVGLLDTLYRFVSLTRLNEGKQVELVLAVDGKILAQALNGDRYEYHAETRTWETVKAD